MSGKGQLIKFENEDQVMKHYLADKENNQVVIFEGVVYNVKDYAPIHPGGEHYLTERLGKDITEDFDEAEHTKSARNTFKTIPVVGSVTSSDADSTSSQGSNKKTKLTNGGATALYGIKMNEELNEKLNFDYDKPLFG